MTIPELLANEELRQTEFPVCRDTIFLAHAGVCPLPRRVAEAIATQAHRSTLGDQEAILDAAQITQTRALAARVIGAQPDEIALVGPTSLGLSLIANGLTFPKGSNVLIYFEDYPSNVYPWMALAERDVEVRFLKSRALGVIESEDVLAQVDGQTALVALASCHFLSGFRIDLARLGSALRERGILFCVDGIQTVGAFPTPAQDFDFLAADSHKWMLGPCGAGILYVRRSLQKALVPTVHGWHNVRCPDFVSQPEIVFRPDARRYEAGTHMLLGLVGLRAALELIEEIGVFHIAAELQRKRTWLVDQLQARGYTVLNPAPPAQHAGGMISFAKAGERPAAIHQRLLEHRVVTSLRKDRAGHEYIRLSPHFYNTDAELEFVLKQL